MKTKWQRVTTIKCENILLSFSCFMSDCLLLFNGISEVQIDNKPKKKKKTEK